MLRAKIGQSSGASRVLQRLLPSVPPPDTSALRDLGQSAEVLLRDQLPVLRTLAIVDH